jgi:hypothetical protein
MAWLIEEFCQTAIPEAFGGTKDYSGDNLSDDQIDGLLETFKVALSQHGDATLPQDRPTLLRIHQRLRERSGNREDEEISTDELADHILQLIDDELAEEGEVA